MLDRWSPTANQRNAETRVVPGGTNVALCAYDVGSTEAFRVIWARTPATENARLTTLGPLRLEGDFSGVQMRPAGSRCHQRAISNPLGETERDQSDRYMVWHDCERTTSRNPSKAIPPARRLSAVPRS